MWTWFKEIRHFHSFKVIVIKTKCICILLHYGSTIFHIAKNNQIENEEIKTKHLIF